MHQSWEWIQAIATLLILMAIFFSKNFFWDIPVSATTPITPPVETFPQKSYWNNTLWYGFSGDQNDHYFSTMSWEVDQVAVDPKEGIIFEDAKVRVLYYKNTSIEEVEKFLTSPKPRAFSHLRDWVAVVEWDLESSSAKTVLATLHNR